MTLREYTETYYPIKEKIEALRKNPIQRIAEQDDLPYEEIVFVDGEFQKVVFREDGTPIPILELLTYDKVAIDKTVDEEFKLIWENYMNDVAVKDIDIKEILSMAEKYRQQLDEKGAD